MIVVVVLGKNALLPCSGTFAPLAVKLGLDSVAQYGELHWLTWGLKADVEDFLEEKIRGNKEDTMIPHTGPKRTWWRDQ